MCTKRFMGYGLDVRQFCGTGRINGIVVTIFIILILQMTSPMLREVSLGQPVSKAAGSRTGLLRYPLQRPLRKPWHRSRSRGTSISQVSTAPNGLCWIRERKVLAGSRPVAERGNHSSSHMPTTELVQSSCAQQGGPSQAAGCTRSPGLQRSACSRRGSWAASWRSTERRCRRQWTCWLRQEAGRNSLGLVRRHRALGFQFGSLLRLTIIVLKDFMKVNEKMLEVLSSEQVSQNVDGPLSPSPCPSCPHHFNSASVD